MLIPIFEQAGESGPKHYSCQLWLNWHQIDIVQGAAPTFLYNCTNDGKGDKFGTNEVDIILYRIKMETFMFVAEFRYACFTHTYTY